MLFIPKRDLYEPSYVSSSTHLLHRFLFNNMDCLFYTWFFPPHRFVIYFELVLGGLSALVLTDHQWSMAKQHGRRCWCIWDLRRHLAEAVIKVKTLTGRIFPSATQRTSLLFVLKNWYYDGIWIVWKSDKDRGRPSEGENYSTHVSV